MGCCESRDEHTKPSLPSQSAQVNAYMTSLRTHTSSLDKLKPHLSYFSQKSTNFFTLLHNLRAAKRSYLQKFEELSTSVDRMLDLLSQLDTEVQAQYMSERESADMTQTDLMTVIQTVRAQKQASKLVNLSENLQKFVEFPDKRGEFNGQIQEKIEVMKKTSASLLGYMKIIEEIRGKIRDICDKEEEWIQKVRNQDTLEEWNQVKNKALFAGKAAYTQALHCLGNYQTIENELQTIKTDIDKAFQEQIHRQKALEAQSTAQQYMKLLGGEIPPIPRKSYRNSIDKLLTEQSTSITGSVYMEEFVRILRRLCLLSYYRDGPVMTAQETYEKMVNLICGKAEADKKYALSSQEKKQAIVPLELFLIIQFASGKEDKKSALVEISSFMASLDLRLKSTRLGGLSLELLRFTESEAMSVHEESFLCRAFQDMQVLLPQDCPDILETWDTAGTLPLAQVIPLVEKWFETEKEWGEEVMSRLIPSHNVVDLTVFYVTMRLVERKMTSEELFYRLDKRKANNLEKTEFAEGLRDTLDVMVSEEMLEEVATVLDKTNSNGIFRTEFNTLFDAAQFESLQRNTKVSRVDVLSSLRSVYIEWKSHLNSQLYLDFLSAPKENNRVSLPHIRPILLSLAPDLTDTHIESFEKQLKNACGDYIAYEGLRDCFLQYPLGTAGKSFFCE